MLHETQAGRDINISHHEDHHYYPVEQSKGEVQSVVDISHLPEPTVALIGRGTELTLLTQAFTNPNKHLAIIVAAGGIGKSALTDEWLRQIATQSYHGKARVFGWSFYSQGSHDTFTNSQPFFNEVLRFLEVTEIPADEIKKAQLLVRCLQQQPCLLILDGLEPLQYAENLSPMKGELQDSALKAFIACFRRTPGKSFVLFSSRQPLVELKKWQAENYLSLDLKTLPHDDGAKLLQALGVTGKTEELLAISENLNGHALSLMLIGHLLKEYHQGDCRYAGMLPILTLAHGDSDAEKDSCHAKQVLDYYDSLQDAASRCFLQLLGLFDRPMSREEKAVLIADAQHAEPLRTLTEKEWQAVEQRLENCGLLLGKKGSLNRLEWDTHPIIRAYFGQKFKENRPESFKQAHLVLFNYYKKVPQREYGKYLPDTLEEMQPLYRAVVHGGLAGEYWQALNDVYKKRILRMNNIGKIEFYSRHQLGAYSQDLTALSAFFPSGWIKPTDSDLPEVEQAWLLVDVSFCLMSLGRLQEAIGPRITGVKFYKKSENWAYASSGIQILVSLHLPLGQLKEAQEVAQQAVKYANSSRDFDQRVTAPCYIATVLHCRGNLREAYDYFQEAEALFQTSGRYEYIPSLSGFWYCNLLLDSFSDITTLEDVETRAAYIVPDHGSLLDAAVTALILARVFAASNKLVEAEGAFQAAIKNIQKANTIFRIPPFYLYRADFYIDQSQLDKAYVDLNSAWEIIERCDMKLYAVDYLLIHGRFSLAIADYDTGLNNYKEAKQLIQETGYHLHDAELDLFAAQLCQQRGNVDGKNANHYLQKAKNRIKEIGQEGLTPYWEKVSDFCAK
ncbi:ATP-binding protein [Methylobacter sp. BBA5.1]|uniref:ATP-binding protein n=1 Tax=Methylobacter sp. BBA5.1 TaxID=1495064 RepID=UPI0005612A72|nr:ATP-binding protein [Methylobacter sp. BBA5.1]